MTRIPTNRVSSHPGEKENSTLEFSRHNGPSGNERKEKRKEKRKKRTPISHREKMTPIFSSRFLGVLFHFFHSIERV